MSQGGFCSLSYAARHPDLFRIALGFSGVPDIWYDKPAYLGAKAIINLTELASATASRVTTTQASPTARGT